MITFPTLKSGVVGQYPAQRVAEKCTWIGRFVDGSEQRFRNEATALHRWVLHLSLLTEAEVVTIREFVDDLSGRFETFSFTDPWTGTVYDNCSLDADANTVEWRADNNGRTTLTIRENRS